MVRRVHVVRGKVRCDGESPHTPRSSTASRCGAVAQVMQAAAENGLSATREDRTPEPAAGHDSPTSILCLQCLPRVLFFPAARRVPAKTSRGWKPARQRAFMFPPMGLQEHKDVLKAAEERLQSLKVSL